MEQQDSANEQRIRLPSTRGVATADETDQHGDHHQQENGEWNDPSQLDKRDRRVLGWVFLIQKDRWKDLR